MRGKTVTLAGFARTIATDAREASRILRVHPELATEKLATGASRQTAVDYFITEISHYIYAGDTALHVAAAAYRTALIKRLVACGAQVVAANRRGQQPLHYAVDGGPGAAHWNPRAQAATIAALVAAGADPDAVDTSGVAPLHRAVRNRCAAAVKALLDCGADRALANGSGSTPARLAAMTTGRGGSGSPEAKAQQAEIVRLLAR
jgi:Ankyrin repeats (3 copies)/Ankyrin repeats (many copies)